MAGTALRLKLALLRGRFRGGWQVKLGIILSLAFGLPFAGLGFGGLAVAGRTLDAQMPLAVVVTALLTFGWAVGPPLLFGVDDTLDPARLLPLPLDRRQLATVMLASSVVGVGPLTTLALLAGLVVGIAPFHPGLVVVLVAALSQFALCIVVSRLVTTALSGALRSRRGRDAAGLLLTMTFVVVPQLPGLLTSASIDLGDLSGPVRAVSLTPFAWFGRAMGEASTGSVTVGVGFLAAGLVLVGVCSWGWLVSLERLVTRAPTAGAASSRDDGLFAGLGGWLPVDRRGANAAVAVRLAARDTRLRVAWLVSVAFGAVALIAAVNLADGGPRGVMGLVATAALVSFQGINLFGVDGPSAAQLVLAGGDHTADVRGRHLGVLVIAVPLLVAYGTVAAVVTGGAGHLPAAGIAAVGTLLFGLGIGSVTSTRFPAPQPEIGRNTFGSATGQNVLNALLQAVAIMCLGLGLLPLLVVVLLVESPAWLAVAAVGQAGIGVVVWRLTTSWAGRVLADRAPEFLGDLAPT